MTATDLTDALARAAGMSRAEVREILAGTADVLIRHGSAEDAAVARRVRDRLAAQAERRRKSLASAPARARKRRAEREAAEAAAAEAARRAFQQLHDQARTFVAQQGRTKGAAR